MMPAAGSLFDLSVEADAAAVDRNRRAFLWSLRSPSSGKYRRYMGSPLRYAGGKSMAVGLILERMPPGITTLVSPFLGGGSLETACAQALGMRVFGYDIFDVLCSYWRWQIEQPESLYQRMRPWSPTRDTFAEVKERLRRHWEGEERMDDGDVAAHYYFNSNMSYGPHFLWWPSDAHLTPRAWGAMLHRVRTYRAPGLSVACADFRDSIPRHRDDFLYCDPPYYLDDGKTFTGMYPNRNHPTHHKGFDHETLRDLLLGHPGGFVLSYNDCDTIRKWYDDCEITAPQWHYGFGLGDRRIGPNRLRDNNGSHIKASHELLISRGPQ